MPADRREYLVLSRGRWDPDLPAERIQGAIDDFYAWHDRCVADGRMRAGQRLGTEGRCVSRQGVTDGPFSEAKEVLGGYWTILADTLDEAAALAAQNPCLACGLAFEVRPVEPARASVYVRGNETPSGATLPPPR